MTRVSWDSVGPFQEYRCVVNGWSVPLLDVRELDGGKVFITLNGFRCYEATVAEADVLIPFLADVIASALGYRVHPRADEDDEEARKARVAAVAHETLAPQRMVEITHVDTEGDTDATE